MPIIHIIGIAKRVATLMQWHHCRLPGLSPSAFLAKRQNLPERNGSPKRVYSRRKTPKYPRKIQALGISQT